MDDLFGSAAKVLTVAELTRAIRGTLETKFGAVWVQGEVSNYKLHPSGHQYFTLKDSRAQISCVIFRNAMGPLRRPLTDGAQVQVYGQISVFEARGQYQLSVQILQPRGLGVLQAKFEALKRKLEAEGLFDPARKRPLPRYPQRIGIVTSPSGAAIRDMLNVLARRGRNLQILINPVRVQGSGAATEIAAAIRELGLPNETWAPLDVLVIARGGGSIEDLWEFNEEAVARAIFESTIPIVSAIGHEIDFTIADFVADLRAPTPSARGGIDRTRFRGTRAAAFTDSEYFARQSRRSSPKWEKTIGVHHARRPAARAAKTNCRGVAAHRFPRGGACARGRGARRKRSTAHVRVAGAIAWTPAGPDDRFAPAVNPFSPGTTM